MSAQRIPPTRTDACQRPSTSVTELEALWAWAKGEAKQKLTDRAQRVGPTDRLVVIATEEDNGRRAVEVVTLAELGSPSRRAAGLGGIYAMATEHVDGHELAAPVYAAKRLDAATFDVLPVGYLRHAPPTGSTEGQAHQPEREDMA